MSENFVLRLSLWTLSFGNHGTGFAQGSRNQPKVAPAVPGSRRIAMHENIDEKIEMHTKKIDYKNHVIWLSSYEMKTGGWIPRALVVLPAEDGNGQQELIYPGEATFPVWEEADKHAFEMGKQWVDQKLAGKS
jgi:hypothetical protein